MAETARDYLREHRVEVVYPQGERPGKGPSAPAKYRTLSCRTE